MKKNPYTDFYVLTSDLAVGRRDSIVELPIDHPAVLGGKAQPIEDYQAPDPWYDDAA